MRRDDRDHHGRSTVEGHITTGSNAELSDVNSRAIDDLGSVLLFKVDIVTSVDT